VIVIFTNFSRVTPGLGIVVAGQMSLCHQNNSIRALENQIDASYSPQVGIVDEHISTTDFSETVAHVNFDAFKLLYETLTTTTFHIDVD